jgi:hypothetical protein
MEKHHSPDNGMEIGGIAGMELLVIVETSNGVGSVVGVALQLSGMTRDIDVKKKAMQRQKNDFIINFFQGT